MAASQPQLHLAERRSPNRGNGCGFRALPSSHSPPPRIAYSGGRRLHATDGGGPADLGVHQNDPERTTPRYRQLRTRSPDRRNRPRMDRGRFAARQPARYSGDVDVNVSRSGRLGRAHLLRCPLTDALRAERTEQCGHPGGSRPYAAVCRVISEISVRLWPSVVPNLVIHTRTLDVLVRSCTSTRLCPGCSGVVGVSSLVSANVAGFSVGEERI